MTRLFNHGGPLAGASVGGLSFLFVLHVAQCAWSSFSPSSPGGCGGGTMCALRTHSDGSPLFTPGEFAAMTSADYDTVADYSLELASGIDSATIVTLKDGSTTGDESTADTSGGKVSLTVTETPTIVLVNGAP